MNQKRKIITDCFRDRNKHSFIVLLCLYVADPATFLALLFCGLYFIFINIVSITTPDLSFLSNATLCLFNFWPHKHTHTHTHTHTQHYILHEPLEDEDGLESVCFERVCARYKPLTALCAPPIISSSLHMQPTSNAIISNLSRPGGSIH